MSERFSDYRRRVSAQMEIAQHFVADAAIPAMCDSCHATVGVIDIGPEEDCDFMCEECLSVGMVDEPIDNLVIGVGRGSVRLSDNFGISLQPLRDYDEQLNLEVLSYNRRNPQKKMKAAWNKVPPRPMRERAWDKAMEPYAAAIEPGES